MNDSNKSIVRDRSGKDKRAPRDLTVNREEQDSPSECDLRSIPLSAMPQHCSDYYPPSEPRRNILQEAQDIVEGDRQRDYGDKRKCFNRIAGMWSGYLGIEINAQQVAHLMIMLKLARNYENYKRDSLVDVCGYAYCADLIFEDELAHNSKFNGEF